MNQHLRSNLRYYVLGTCILLYITSNFFYLFAFDHFLIIFGVTLICIVLVVIYIVVELFRKDTNKNLFSTALMICLVGLAIFTTGNQHLIGNAIFLQYYKAEMNEIVILINDDLQLESYSRWEINGYQYTTDSNRVMYNTRPEEKPLYYIDSVLTLCGIENTKYEELQNLLGKYGGPVWSNKGIVVFIAGGFIDEYGFLWSPSSETAADLQEMEILPGGLYAAIYKMDDHWYFYYIGD